MNSPFEAEEFLTTEEHIAAYLEEVERNYPDLKEIARATVKAARERNAKREARSLK